MPPINPTLPSITISCGGSGNSPYWWKRERYPQERIYLDTRFLHFLKEAVFYIPATHIIIKYTYLHTFFYFLDKELLHLFSYLVITEYIILYMDMVGRFLDLFQQVFELIGTIRKIVICVPYRREDWLVLVNKVDKGL